MNESVGGRWYTERGKRFVDFSLAIIALVTLSPLLCLISLLVLLSMGWPIYFIQRRPGREGRSFEILKYRTMEEGRTRSGVLLPDGERLTRLGRFLRRTSLDELPELFNVLRGDMSLVGPRPLLIEYVNRYSPEQARRMEVRPGITGWAQVNGRNAIDWDKKFEYDVWYVDHISFLLDLKIFWLTLQSVFTREGISYPGHVTMPGFLGQKDLRH